MRASFNKYIKNGYFASCKFLHLWKKRDSKETYCHNNNKKKKLPTRRPDNFPVFFYKCKKKLRPLGRKASISFRFGEENNFLKNKQQAQIA